MGVGRGAHGNWPTAATGRRPERSHVSGEVPPRALRFRPGEAPGSALSMRQTLQPECMRSREGHDDACDDDQTSGGNGEV